MTELDEKQVPADAPADRLDKVVARLFGVSRGRAMDWIAEGRVRKGPPNPGMAIDESIGWTGAASMKNPAPPVRCAKWCEATLCGAP